MSELPRRGAEPEATPLAWRGAAAALLFGGLGLGAALGRSARAPLVPMLTGGIAAVTAIPLAIASRRPPVSPEAARSSLELSPSPPTFSVVVAARDEANALPGLVADIAAQDYCDADGRPLFELVIVDDRSVDGTGELAIKAAHRCGIGEITRLIRRDGEDLPDGKGAALTAAQPEMCRGDVVVVLDGDARIGRGFLRHAAGYFAAGLPAVTARRRTAHPGWSGLAMAQADEQNLDGELQRGRWAMGGCSEYRGNGIMVRRDVLARVGGWRARALTEDIDLSSRIAAAEGATVAWAIDVEVWEEPVRSWSGLWRQRLRWGEGALRRAFEHTPLLLSSRRLPPVAKFDYLTYVGQLAVPAIGLGFAAGAGSRRQFALVASTLGGYLAAGAILGWDALRWEERDGAPIPAAERAVRTARVACFNTIWLFVMPRALWNLAFRSGHVPYAKMEHVGAPPRASAREARDG